MEILIKNNQKKYRCPKKQITDKCTTILNYLNFKEIELSVLITDDKEIKKLNNQYRQKNSPTNILSFAPNQNFFPISNDILGDIVISIETLRREADTKKMTISQRLSQLLIHGILHLTGYEHSKEMEDKSLEILRLLEKDRRLDFI